MITYHRNISAVQWFLRKSNGCQLNLPSVRMDYYTVDTCIQWTSLTLIKELSFWRRKLNQKVLRFMVYKTFVNILSCKDFDRNIRYILPACVVTKIRAQFPNPSGEPYTGYVKINSRDGQSLPKISRYRLMISLNQC